MQRLTSHLWLGGISTLVLLVLFGVRAGGTAVSQINLPPTFSHSAGFYEQDINLSIHANNPAATIWYTLDGCSPSAETGFVYERPLHFNANQPQIITLRARTISPAGTHSPVASASYALNIPASLPILSFIVEPDDIWSAERGIYANPGEHGREWERLVDVTYIDKDRTQGFHTAAGIRIHGRGSRLIDKKSYRLYFRSEYGPPLLNYPMFSNQLSVTSYQSSNPQSLISNRQSPISNPQSLDRLVIHNSGQDSMLPGTNWTLVRNQLVAALAFDLGHNATRSQPALLFINGEVWGIFQIRERIDATFLADHYGILEADMLDTPEEVIRDDWVVLGDRQHWDHLMTFLEENSLVDPANYAYVQTQVDLDNFIDYQLLQIYAANDDWPVHNVRQFRPRTQGGRWQWMFWDTDRSFAYRIASPVEKDMIAHAQTLTHPDTSGRHSLLLRRLLENPDFRNRFLARLDLLLNTTFAPEAVIAHIDRLAGEIEPDIDYERGRWVSDWSPWEVNIEELRDFARRRPDFVRQHVDDWFGS